MTIFKIISVYAIGHKIISSAWIKSLVLDNHSFMEKALTCGELHFGALHLVFAKS